MTLIILKFPHYDKFNISHVENTNLQFKLFNCNNNNTFRGQLTQVTTRANGYNVTHLYLTIISCKLTQLPLCSGAHCTKSSKSQFTGKVHFVAGSRNYAGAFSHRHILSSRSWSRDCTSESGYS